MTASRGQWPGLFVVRASRLESASGQLRQKALELEAEASNRAKNAVPRSRAVSLPSNLAAAALRLVADDASLLRKLLKKSSRGRPTGSIAPDLALDYEIRKELLGKAAAAKKAVALDWGVDEQRVRDACTSFGADAKQRLSDEVERNLEYARTGKSLWLDVDGSVRPPDRAMILARCSDAVLAFHRETQATKRSRKK